MIASTPLFRLSQSGNAVCSIPSFAFDARFPSLPRSVWCCSSQFSISRTRTKTKRVQLPDVILVVGYGSRDCSGGSSWWHPTTYKTQTLTSAFDFLLTSSRPRKHGKCEGYAKTIVWLRLLLWTQPNVWRSYKLAPVLGREALWHDGHIIILY